MKKLHQYLLDKHSWYTKWHQQPYHRLSHWALFLFLTLVFSSNIFYTIAQSYDIQGGYSKQTNTEVQPQINTPVSFPNSEKDFTGYDITGKIDTAIYRMLEKQDKVSVIVQLNLPKVYYDPVDNSTARTVKSKAFANAKKSVTSSIGTNGKIKLDLKIINGLALDVNLKALEGLKNNPNITFVDLDREVEAFLDTSTNEINTPYAWMQTDTNGNTLTGVGVRIAIIDTGVDYTHPDLGRCLGPNCKVISGYDFVNNDNDPMDDQGHGTHVAATAAGKGLFKGVAPDAKIIAYKVLDANGFGDTSAVIAAIGRASDPNQDGNPADHIDVANMSLGSHCGLNTYYNSGCGPDDVVSLAVNLSTMAGVVYAVAAGNNGPQATIASPGTAASAITVAAACKSTQIGINSNCANPTSPIASFSSRGPVINIQGINLNKPDISAPGVGICAARWANAFPTSPTCYDSGHARLNGTSMATPHIAGVAALLKQANPSYTPLQIKNRIKDTTRLLPGMTYNDQGAGMVDLQTATSKSCGIILSDTFYGSSSQTYAYSSKILDFTDSDMTITISYDTGSASNRFIVRKVSDNNIVSDTGWLGSGSVGSFLFTKTEKNYKLDVETKTNWLNRRDSWSTSIRCAGSPPPPPPANLDITPPSVSITSPLYDATVSGTVNISATATDNISVNRVSFSRLNLISVSPFLNLVFIDSDITSPYNALWNTTSIPNGIYFLSVSASDITGNSTNSKSVKVNVYNYVPPPPTEEDPCPLLSASTINAYNTTKLMPCEPAIQ